MSGDFSDVMLELLKILGLGLLCLIIVCMFAAALLFIAAVLQHLWDEHKAEKAAKKEQEEENWR